MADFTATRLFTYINGTIIDPGQNNPNENEIYNKHNASMDATTGHKHTGTVGDGPLLGATSIDLTATYPWTGTHSFASTVSFAAATSFSAVSTVSFLNDFTVAATKKIFFGAGADTYIYEQGADVITVVNGGITSGQFLSGGFSVPGTQKLYLDGGGDTYITESSANIVRLFTGGVEAMNWQPAYVEVSPSRNFIINSGKFLYIDGGGDTFIYESAANVINFNTGGVSRAELSGNGLLLEDIDPPVANYMNRNSGVKAWGHIAPAGTVNNSYNSSCVRNSAGNYTVSWGTSFSTANYALTVTPRGTVRVFALVATQGTGSANITFETSAGTFTDTSFTFIAIGDQ